MHILYTLDNVKLYVVRSQLDEFCEDHLKHHVQVKVLQHIHRSDYHIYKDHIERIDDI